MITSAFEVLKIAEKNSCKLSEFEDSCPKIAKGRGILDEDRGLIKIHYDNRVIFNNRVVFNAIIYYYDRQFVKTNKYNTEIKLYNKDLNVFYRFQYLISKDVDGKNSEKIEFNKIIIEKDECRYSDFYLKTCVIQDIGLKQRIVLKSNEFQDYNYLKKSQELSKVPSNIVRRLERSKNNPKIFNLIINKN